VSASAFIEAWRGAQLAEIAWLDPDGRPDIAVVVPLVDDHRPAAALTYDRLGEASRIDAARTVTLAVATPAVAQGREPVALRARVHVEEDPRGTTFQDRFLLQELAKHPPSRLRADSILLRSEHWWYLPRVLVWARPEAGPQRLPLRDALAAIATPEGLTLATTDLDGVGEDARPATALPDGPAVVLQHGADVPDLERPWHRRWRGEVVAGALRVDDYAQRAPRPHPEGLWRRWRDEVALARACRAGLRRAGHG
jgi:hypothetical protein